MRPTFHCATKWPWSAAYCRAVKLLALSAPSGTPGPRRPSFGVSDAVLGLLVPSKAETGPSTMPRPNTLATATNMPPLTTRAICSDVRIALFLNRPARVGDGAAARRSDLLGVFPQITGGELFGARLPVARPLFELAFGQLDVERARDRVDLDDVAVTQQADGSTDRRFRPDMADAKTAGGARETSVGDQGDLVAHALTIERGRGREHLAHARPALGAFVTDHQHFAFPVRLVLDRFEASLLAIEAARRTGKTQALHAGNLNDRTFRCENAPQTNNPAGREHRFVRRMNHILSVVPLHRLEIFRDRAAGDSQTLAMQIAMIEEGLHQQRYPPSFEHVFGDITAAGFQIRDIWCLFEDLGHIK